MFQQIFNQIDINSDEGLEDRADLGRCVINLNDAKKELISILNASNNAWVGNAKDQFDGVLNGAGGYKGKGLIQQIDDLIEKAFNVKNRIKDIESIYHNADRAAAGRS